MLRFYKYLYKLTGYCPAWLELRIQVYAQKRLKLLCQPGYYIGNPSLSLDIWRAKYEVKLGLYRTTFKSYYRYLKNKWRIK